MAEVREFPNVYEHPDFEEAPSPKGKWQTEIFKNSNPITLELACGKGEYTIHLAREYPQRNFVGIDIKGPRIWKGAKIALEESLQNVRFLRIFIDHLDRYFGRNEVNEIWITFPDPYIRKKSRISKRLTSPKFLNIYRNVLKPEGIIHLKTDSDILYEYTLQTIAREKCTVVSRDDDVYTGRSANSLLTAIQTYYEKKHLEAGKTIRYVAFQL